jgi:hypothetical protein
METLENLDPLLRTFWYIAIPTSLIFVIQTVMTFMGTDATHSFDTESTRSINFFHFATWSVFCWVSAGVEFRFMILYLTACC